jgi:hypothetical protein
MPVAGRTTDHDLVEAGAALEPTRERLGTGMRAARLMARRSSALSCFRYSSSFSCLRFASASCTNQAPGHPLSVRVETYVVLWRSVA